MNQVEIPHESLVVLLENNFEGQDPTRWLHLRGMFKFSYFKQR